MDRRLQPMSPLQQRSGPFQCHGNYWGGVCPGVLSLSVILLEQKSWFLRTESHRITGGRGGGRRQPRHEPLPFCCFFSLFFCVITWLPRCGPQTCTCCKPFSCTQSNLLCKHLVTAAKRKKKKMQWKPPRVRDRCSAAQPQTGPSFLSLSPKNGLSTDGPQMLSISFTH